MFKPELNEELRLALELAEKELLPRVGFCFESAAKNVWPMYYTPYL